MCIRDRASSNRQLTLVLAVLRINCGGNGFRRNEGKYVRKLPVLLVFACLAKANAQDEVWLRPPVPPDMTPEQLAQTQQNKNQRDIVDARLAENRQLATLLKLAEEDLGQEEWGRAIQRLQGVLNQQQSGLVRIGPGEFVSVRSKANQLLTKLPTAWSKRYEQQFGAAADRMLSAAVREGDYVEVGNVATRYLHTDAGRRAIRILMLRHFDRGEYGLVLGWQQQLVQCGHKPCLLYTSPSPRDATLSRMPSSA